MSWAVSQLSPAGAPGTARRSSVHSAVAHEWSGSASQRMRVRSSRPPLRKVATRRPRQPVSTQPPTWTLRTGSAVRVRRAALASWATSAAASPAAGCAASQRRCRSRKPASRATCRCGALTPRCSATRPLHALSVPRISVRTSIAVPLMVMPGSGPPEVCSRTPPGAAPPSARPHSSYICGRSWILRASRRAQGAHSRRPSSARPGVPLSGPRLQASHRTVVGMRLTPARAGSRCRGR
ncbi:hypothetical protein JT723_20780 [Streptomyces bryophytorum]|uniref:hypothetical protein n=1 Tax=Actinacidiphila bryophytorum TaxID=1436133 RepID=UPI001961BE4F|nr:hypothetical protein [Actinacidiphila bryophytorum]MBM9438279.1 hypothetical protein [Actinacidiphila bryophytorum]